MNFLGRPKWFIWPWERKNFWFGVLMTGIAMFVAGMLALAYFIQGLINTW